MNPHQATRDFETALCAYTGAPYAVTVTSCTMALLLAVSFYVQSVWWWKRWAGTTPEQLMEDQLFDDNVVEIPKRTYVGVPMSIVHAGGKPTFRDEEWLGCYRLRPLPIWDSARWFSSGMYSVGGTGSMVCVSFHAAKILADTQGGAILHDSPEADAWLRRARFDGRAEGVAPKDDKFMQFGWHCYMSPDVASRLLWKLSVLPEHNEPLPCDDYPDLSTMEIFR